MSTTSLKSLIAAFAFGAVALTGTAPAMAHDGWGHDGGWRHEAWQEHRWHERMWAEHHRPPVVMVAPGYATPYPPQVMYAPPPQVVYAPPVVYRPAPPPSVTFVIPLR